MDARDLSRFADRSFALVMFSFNGIDAVDYAGRLAILREFARVLRPGGVVMFSTHNRQGPSYRETLSHFVRLPHLSVNPIAVGIDTARVLCNLPLATFNYLRHSRLHRECDGQVRLSIGGTREAFVASVIALAKSENRRERTKPDERI